MANSGVYLITNNKNNHKYVGSAVNLYRRIKRHSSQLQAQTHYNEHLQRAWDKYGEEAFEFRSLALCVKRKKSLLALEQFYINLLRPEYNICMVAGSPLGITQTKETRAKKSAAALGRKASAEARANMSAAQKGRKHTDETKAKMSATRKGKKHTDESKAKISAMKMGNKNALGYKHTDETRAKMSAAQMGHGVTDEARANMSAAQMGNKNSIGRKCTPETRAKISAATLGRKHTPETRAKMSKPWSEAKRASYEKKRVDMAFEKK